MYTESEKEAYHAHYLCDHFKHSNDLKNFIIYLKEKNYGQWGD